MYCIIRTAILDSTRDMMRSILVRRQLCSKVAAAHCFFTTTSTLSTLHGTLASYTITRDTIRSCCIVSFFEEAAEYVNAYLFRGLTFTHYVIIHGLFCLLFYKSKSMETF
jgi:hypothetical protein